MKLGTDASHTKAMKKSLVCALLENDRIKTTETRAKAIRGDVDRVITWAKKGDLASRRNAIAKIGDAELVRETFEKAEQGMWADRNGGYTRIMKLGPRKGDNAEVVIMELVTEAVTPKTSGKTEVKPVKKAAAKKPAAKKAAKKADEPKADAEETKAEDTKAEETKADAEEKAE
jgi:large subunit ribosomal protein L17